MGRHWGAPVTTDQERPGWVMKESQCGRLRYSLCQSPADRTRQVFPVSSEDDAGWTSIHSTVGAGARRP